MVLLNFIIAVVLAGGYASIIVSVAMRRRGVVWFGFWFYFVILTAAMWVMRLWLELLPAHWAGEHLLLTALFGLAVSLILLAGLLPRRAGDGGRRLIVDPGGITRSDDDIPAETGRMGPEVAPSTRGLLYWVGAIALAGALLAVLVVAFALR